MDVNNLFLSYLSTVPSSASSFCRERLVSRRNASHSEISPTHAPFPSVIAAIHKYCTGANMCSSPPHRYVIAAQNAVTGTIAPNNTHNVVFLNVCALRKNAEGVHDDVRVAPEAFRREMSSVSERSNATSSSTMTSSATAAAMFAPRRVRNTLYTPSRKKKKAEIAWIAGPGCGSPNETHTTSKSRGVAKSARGSIRRRGHA
jgi:hypothetical protein